MRSRLLFGALLPFVASVAAITVTVTVTQSLTLVSTQPASTLTLQQTPAPVTTCITQTASAFVSISTTTKVKWSTLTVTATDLSTQTLPPATLLITLPASSTTIFQTPSPVTIYVTQTEIPFIVTSFTTQPISISTKTKTTTLTITASNVLTLPPTTVQITQTLPPNTIFLTSAQPASTLIDLITVNQTLSLISISTTTLKFKTKTSTTTSIQTETTVAAAPCYPSSSPDRILNGGFEADGAGWTFYEYRTSGATNMSEVLGTASNGAYQGTYMLRVEFLSNNNPGIAIISPTFNSPQAYNLSFAVRVDVQHSDTTGCQGWLYSGTGDSPIDDWNQMDLSSFTGRTSWVTYPATFVGGILEDTIEIDIDTCLNDPVWYFDSFISVPA